MNSMCQLYYVLKNGELKCFPLHFSKADHRCNPLSVNTLIMHLWTPNYKIFISPVAIKSIWGANFYLICNIMLTFTLHKLLASCFHPAPSPIIPVSLLLSLPASPSLHLPAFLFPVSCLTPSLPNSLFLIFLSSLGHCGHLCIKLANRKLIFLFLWLIHLHFHSNTYTDSLSSLLCYSPLQIGKHPNISFQESFSLHKIVLHVYVG